MQVIADLLNIFLKVKGGYVIVLVQVTKLWYQTGASIKNLRVIVTVFKLIILSKTQRKLISSDRKTWKH